MSLLLDALRKSESRRRLGQAPGLELPGIPVSPRRPGRGVWLAAPVLLVVAAIAAWWWWPAPSAPPPAGQLSSTPLPAEESPDEARPAIRRPDPAPVVDESQVTRPQTPATVPDTVPEVEDDESATRADTRAPAAGVPQPESGSEPESERRADPDTVAETLPDAAADGGPDRVDRGSVAEYLQVWELPRNIRAGLPALDLSINVYSERPESRFALINGERFQEGDEVAPGVVVHRITREGAVLDYRDYRFLLD